MDIHTLTLFFNQINREYDDQFLTVNTEDYAKKLIDHAEIISYSANSNLISLIAFYANNEQSKIAFLSFIGTSKKYRSKGIGKHLIDMMINVVKSRGYNKIQLEVYKTNTKAFDFYKKLGFSLVEEHEKVFLLQKDI